MKAFMFPGQGCQSQGMGKELFESTPLAREYFEKANDILGWRLTDVMFDGSELEISETKNTQPAVFLYSTILALTQDKILPDVVAGHSLGEYSALVVSGALSFEAGLQLVVNRARIAQKVCEQQDTAMAAVVGLPDDFVVNRVREISNDHGEPVFIANFNGPGQIVITGSRKGIRIACKVLKQENAKRAVPLNISGSFHSPYMEQARLELGMIIDGMEFHRPKCPIVQCADGKIHTDPDLIKGNLKSHITNTVNWTAMVYLMSGYGITEFYESGPDDTLQKIVARMLPDAYVTSLRSVSE